VARQCGGSTFSNSFWIFVACPGDNENDQNNGIEKHAERMIPVVPDIQPDNYRADNPKIPTVP